MKSLALTDSPFGRYILAKTRDRLSQLKYVDKTAKLKATHTGLSYSQNGA